MPVFHKQKKYLAVSICSHAFIILVLILGFDVATPLPVLENTNKNDIISAVVLGDTKDSKIMPQLPPPKPAPKEIKQEVKEEPKPKPLPKRTLVESNQVKEAIALKVEEKKKQAAEKALEEKKRKDKLADDLLADIKKVNKKQKNLKQKQLKAQFEKTLREQAEKSLRQQLLNEDIKLQGTQSRQAQGEVNKYKALILQAISERWIVPTQANKKLYCELMIRVAPGGVVLDVQITKSSGDPALDSSARAAVLKASPLPVPTNPEAFEAFRQFVLKVKPENILTNDGGMVG